VSPPAGMAPPDERPLEGPPEPPRPEVQVVEAGPSRERTCADCGRRTAAWKPVRRHGTSVIICSECASKPAPDGSEACPSCATPLRPRDRFCGRCGLRIEYACPTCGSALDLEDAFCGRCGTRVA